MSLPLGLIVFLILVFLPLQAEASKAVALDPVEEARRAFRLIDVNGDGYIEQSELGQVSPAVNEMVFR